MRLTSPANLQARLRVSPHIKYITEEEINTTIRNISDQNRITVLIAHRLSTIMHADKIFVLEQGKIIEQGKHDDLLVEKGLYYAMWRQQIGERK